MSEENLLVAAAQAYVDEVWEDVVADIDYLVQVESVEDMEHAAPGMPFGPAPREALDRALQIAERLGLEPHDLDGYVGYGELAGKSKRCIATIAHSDIVPLGNGWTFDPLRVTRKDGCLVGRGVIDDKGPLVLSLYMAHFAARMVHEYGEPLPYTLRCIIGTNEETQMRDVDYYVEHEPQPAFCFTPDAMYPLICGEKGRFACTVVSGDMGSDGRIVSIEGGVAQNAIPSEASALVRARTDEIKPLDGIEVVAQPDGLTKVMAHGRGGHAAMPEGTLNAIGLLVEQLLKDGICTDCERAFLEFEHLLFADSAGEALGIATQEPCLGALTCVGGVIRTESRDGSRRFTQTIDMRYPLSTSGEVLESSMAHVTGRHGCMLDSPSDVAPFYVSPHTPEIRALLEAYEQVTGRRGEAFTIGGGTYSRHFERAVAFGPLEESDPMPDWVGPEHGADEGVPEDMLKRALVVYIVALAKLMRL